MTLAPNVTLKWVYLILKIFGRNDLKIQLDHVWTMRGPSFANVKDKRGTKERPPGPKGYHRPPPPHKIYSFKDYFELNFDPGPKFKLKMGF